MASKKLDYDADITRKFAATLYRRARFLAVGYGFIGAFLSGAAIVLFADVPLGTWQANFIYIVAAAAGYNIGEGKKFELRLQAQTALAQVQIEMNTRAKNS